MGAGINRRQGRQALALALGTAVAAAPLGAAEPDPAARRGPAAIHDEQLLAQPRLTLAALPPDTLGKGRWAFRVSFLWSNSFSWTQDRAGEFPEDRRFLIDGEAGTVDWNVARGISDRLDVALRVPLRWRGGGMLDGLIDAWHQVVHLPDGLRTEFGRNLFRVRGITPAGRVFSWDSATGLGLGNLELGARWRLRDGGRAGWSVAAAPVLSLPTGSAPFDGSGFAFGIQGLAAKRLATALDLIVGTGGTAAERREVRGIDYSPVRGHLFGAIEWRPGRSWSLVAETSVATRLVDGIDQYPGVHWVANLAAMFDLPARTRLEVGFTENIIDQRSTTDFAVYLALSVRK